MFNEFAWSVKTWVKWGWFSGINCLKDIKICSFPSIQEDVCLRPAGAQQAYLHTSVPYPCPSGSVSGDNNEPRNSGLISFHRHSASDFPLSQGEVVLFFSCAYYVLWCSLSSFHPVPPGRGERRRVSDRLHHGCTAGAGCSECPCPMLTPWAMSYICRNTMSYELYM